MRNGSHEAELLFDMNEFLQATSFEAKRLAAQRMSQSLAALLKAMDREPAEARGDPG